MSKADQRTLANGESVIVTNGWTLHVGGGNDIWIVGADQKLRLNRRQADTLAALLLLACAVAEDQSAD